MEATTLLQLSQDDLEQTLERLLQKVVSDHAEDTWLDVKQASEYLALTEDGLRQLMRKGRVPVHRIGERRIRFSRAELSAWVRSGAAEAA
jgi:excisionase family DNA binding protein